MATHLTCVGRTVDELREYLRSPRRRGRKRCRTARRSAPRGHRVSAGCRRIGYANELVALIRAEFPEFGIAVAGYPETHQEAPSSEIDLANLKRKVDTGADAVITQVFYDNADFFRFRDRCTAVGIDVPIVPGLLPVTDFAKVQRITALCGAKLPASFVGRLESAGDDADAQFAIGVEFATRQTQALVNAGVPGIHFYVLNRSEAAAEVLQSVIMPH